MSTGGALKKILLKGIPFAASSDADIGIDEGGRRITEVQNTTKGPVFLVDDIAGFVEGVPIRVFGSDGSLPAIRKILKECAEGTPVSCLITLADGTEYTPKGGAMVHTDDGKYMSREGLFTINITAVSGEWIPS